MSVVAGIGSKMPTGHGVLLCQFRNFHFRVEMSAWFSRRVRAMKRVSIASIVVLAIASNPVSAQSNERSSAEIFARPVAIERQALVTHLPITLRNGKLHIAAIVDGQTSEFLFDTGSPTVLAKQFADTLGLKVIGQNVGVDSHGNQVTMKIAIVDRLSLGDFTFRQVPVLIHDFSGTDMGQCLIGNGLIGSEIFPASVWRIDTQAKKLSIAANTGELPSPRGKSLHTKLYDVGYPHAPIIDYSVGDLADKAMFDTGNNANISFFHKIVDTPTFKRAVVPGTVAHGEGYEGESAGGLSKIGPLTHFEVSGVSFSSDKLDATESIVRAMPPTLFGAGLLQTYIVTLDYPGGRMLLEKRSEADAIQPDPGYGISIVDGRAVISRLFAKSAAESAGLKLGDHVIEAQGHSLTQLDGLAYCETVKWLVQEFKSREAAELVIQRKDGTHRFSIPAID
ncbi:MAG TPA: aspartyl protease family protein [Dokdonella sp.]|uniref:aspartyl protease family protein n=1 Tax=Dokdonella sp. TaxID=2291710 RepID=UPI002D7EFA48|nr:aspartyl protease family protein [Dokdonella sp.]HET9032856.1 aspartyl protease family protein [Dokdonella sp.]